MAKNLHGEDSSTRGAGKSGSRRDGELSQPDALAEEEGR